MITTFRSILILSAVVYRYMRTKPSSSQWSSVNHRIQNGIQFKEPQTKHISTRRCFLFLSSVCVCAFCIDFQEFNTADDDDDDAVQPTQTQFRPC